MKPDDQPLDGGKASPLVSIGLPVYNGEEYLRESIESVLAQDFKDFELLIADNASTDGTWDICREYASRDSRVRIHRQEKNRGAVFNFEYVFRNTTAPYFMWHAHDDLMDPTYVRRCYEFLVNAPDYVLCHAITVFIDEQGRRVREMEGDDSLTDETPLARYRTFLARGGSGHVFGIYGLIRRASLSQIEWSLMKHLGGDFLALVQLTFLGKFYRIHEPLRAFRIHLIPPYQRMREPSSSDVMLIGPHTAQRVAPNTRCFAALLMYGLRHPELPAAQRASYVLHTLRYLPPTHPLKHDLLRPVFRLAYRNAQFYYGLKRLRTAWARLWSILMRRPA